MIKTFKKIAIYGVHLACTIGIHANDQTNLNINYQFALVRNLSSSFENSLKLHQPLLPIDLNLATQQHENYIHLLEQLIPTVVHVDADPSHPDCNFIEDTAIIVNDIAVISRMGAAERQGEEIAVQITLESIGTKYITHIQAPGTMDGGDVLYTGKHLFVGLSRRTNECALNQLKEIFQDTLEVVGITVNEGLHLKSVISLFDHETLVVADTPVGIEIRNLIDSETNSSYTFVLVPDSTASNVLRIGSTLIVQDGFPASEKILQDYCNQKNVKLVNINMSELIKADGALTCGSLLFN